MSKQTFDQALRTTLSNLRMHRIASGEESTWHWHDALAEDHKSVEDIIDHLCADLSLVTGRQIVRFTKLRTQTALGMHPGMTLEDTMAFNAQQLNKSTGHFLKHVFNSIRADPRPEGIFTFPVNRIYWDKYGANTILPDALGRPVPIKVLDPERVPPEEVDQPPHISTLLKKCEQTHFDYRPYVLKDGHCKILALELGCDWPDLAISTWDRPPLISLTTKFGLVSFLCFLMMSGGLWLSSTVTSMWAIIPLIILSTVCGIVGGLIATFIGASFIKPLKV